MENNKKYSTAKDLDNAVESVTFVAHPWIARGVLTLLVSSPGLGKTSLAADVGKRFLIPELGWFDGQSLNVAPNSKIVWCDTEAFQGALKDRFDSMGMPKERVLLPFPDPLQEFSLEKDITHLDDLVGESKPVLVVVDSLRGSHKRDENESDMQNLLHPLSTLVQKRNICCLVIHHINKPLPGMPDIIQNIHRIRGSSAIAAEFRSVWALDDPNPGSGYRRLHQIKNNIGPMARPLGIKITKSEVLWNHNPPQEPRSKSRKEEAFEFLLEVLKDGPRLAKEIEEEAAQIGIAKMTLRRAGKYCLKRTKLSKDGNGQWLWDLKAISLDPANFVEE